ncbi:MAG: hypothetical protein ACD_79C00657G0003, partial [uncultured bacterium]
GTLEDIQKKLNSQKTHQNGTRNTTAKKPVFDIAYLRPGNAMGWRTKNTKGNQEKLYGIEALFEVNLKDEKVKIPYHFCYFYDKDKNLMDRKNADLIFKSGSNRSVEIEGDLIVEGDKLTRIIFAYPASFKYKYVVCVIGNEENLSVMCYPKSESYKDFEFDEKTKIKE